MQIIVFPKYLPRILSIRIGQITGLGLEKIKESAVSEGEGNEEEDDMPSAYCTVILNQNEK